MAAQQTHSENRDTTLRKTLTTENSSSLCSHISHLADISRSSHPMVPSPELRFTLSQTCCCNKKKKILLLLMRAEIPTVSQNQQVGLPPRTASNSFLKIKKKKKREAAVGFFLKGRNKLEIEMTLISFLFLGISSGGGFHRRG